MFTGLVQHRGTVERIDHTASAVGSHGARRLIIDASGWAHRPGHGGSIAVSGCCLTAVIESKINAASEAPRGGSVPNRLAFDVVPQTLSRTTLGDLKPGDAVNLESCVTPSTLLGGHIVQGHVDGVGIIVEVARSADEGVRVAIRPPADLMDYLVPQGSVAVDGVSLTLAAVHADRFEVALIPTTLVLTTLGAAAPGRRVNLETDLLVKTVVHHLRRIGTRPTG